MVVAFFFFLFFLTLLCLRLGLHCVIIRHTTTCLRMVLSLSVSWLEFTSQHNGAEHKKKKKMISGNVSGSFAIFCFRCYCYLLLLF